MIDEKYFVIDSHCHIYPEKIALRAVAGTDNFYSTESSCDGTVKMLFEEGTKAGIDHFIVQSVATTPKQVKSINEFIAASVAEGKGRLTGLGTLHPDSTDLAGDVQHILELGLNGVKLHPDIQGFKVDDYRCLKIYELCEREHLPILMHTGDYRYDFSNPNRLLPILKIYTDLTIIGAHFGGWSIYEQAANELAGTPNLYVDCSSSLYCMTSDTARKLIHQYGADRVLFGTDYPMWSPSDVMKSFLDIDLTDEEKRMIFSENGKKVFNINP